MSATIHSPTALDRARAATDHLFTTFDPAAWYERPIPERHRIIFYLGHLEAFDWNLLGRYALAKPAISVELDQLFAFGIDPDSTALPTDRPGDWPEREAVERYCAEVRSRVDALLPDAPSELLHVACEHRLMHAETFGYMLHNLDERFKPGYGYVTNGSSSSPDRRYVHVEGAPVTLGRQRGSGFGWDNEFDAHEVDVAPFEASRYKVTNGEYLDFVKQGAPPPHFWTQRDGDWYFRGAFRSTRLPLDWPVYVTHAEASAYAASQGARLMTEAEHQLAAAGSNPVNCDFERWDPVAVTAGEPNDHDLVQMTGNGWEWTSSAFEPFPGYEPFPFYRNYSEPFFDGQHYVLKGASPRTARELTRPSFRNWFRPEYPYVYATFRLARS